MSTEISVIIVSWNVRELLRRCLTTLYTCNDGLQFDVHVIDNNSSDGTVSMVREAFPQTSLYEQKKNLGFARACNLGAQHAGGKYLLFLNPDTEFIENSLERLVQWLTAHPDGHIAGCTLLNPNKSIQKSVRRFPSLSALTLILLKLHRVFPHILALRTYLYLDFDYTQEQRVDQVMGASFCVRAETFRKLNGFDEGYFIWFEEVDFCKRANMLGFQTWYTTSTKIIHHGGQSFIQTSSPRRQVQFFRSALKYTRAHMNVFSWVALCVFFPLSISFACIQQIFTYKKNRYGD